MPNWNEVVTTGEMKSWDRSPQIRFINAYGQPPAVAVDMENLTVLPDAREIHQPIENAVLINSGENREMPWLDPLTDEPLAGLPPLTEDLVASVVYSVARFALTERDRINAAQLTI